jgi:hypothetical protein
VHKKSAPLHIGPIDLFSFVNLLAFILLSQDEHIHGALFFDIDHLSDLNTNVSLGFCDLILYIHSNNFVGTTGGIQKLVSNFIII